MNDTIHMGTTKVSPAKTISEIQKLLAKNGIRQIMVEYDQCGEPSGLTFTIERNNISLVYKLPANTEKLVGLVTAPRGRHQAQAKRTGWRLIFRWLQAQFALIEVGMVETTEVFLPYCWDGKQTAYEVFAQNHGLLSLEDRTVEVR